MSVWVDKLKLSKQLVRSITDAGFLAPKEIQVKTMSRIVGGQDIIAVGPEGSGKTSTYILGILTRLKYGFEEAPRALVLVPTKEKVLEVIEQIERLNKNETIRTVGLYAMPGMESQLNALADGCDIVVATPDRARAIYLKLALNLNKIIMMVVDDAELIVKQGLQLPVVELANSIQKCQHLVFTEVIHDKLNKMIAPFMNLPAIIEVEEMGDSQSELYPQILYHVPNFRTKLNLLLLLMEDAEVFTKIVVFVNTRLTAEKVYQSLSRHLKGEMAILNPIFFESEGIESIAEFHAAEKTRILIVANEYTDSLDLSGIPFILHFDLPEEKETFLNRVVRRSDEYELMAITFSTDIELAMVRKIEHASGQKIPVADLPADLIVEIEQAETGTKKKKTKAPKEELPRGAAFHEKKESNSKTYNYGSGVKAKMTNKKKHS